MAKIIYEKREFKDRNTGITTEYDYIAIAGNDSNSNSYEVQLKNLVQSEKMVLKMLADMETVDGLVSTRKANGNESPEVNRKSDSDEFFKGMDDGNDTIDLDD